MSMLDTLEMMNRKSTPELIQITQNPPMPGLQTPAMLILNRRKREATNTLMQPDSGQSMKDQIPQDIENLVRGIQQMGQPQQPQPMVNPAAQPPMPMQQAQLQQPPPQPQGPPQGYAEGGLVSFAGGSKENAIWPTVDDTPSSLATAMRNLRFYGTGGVDKFGSSAQGRINTRIPLRNGNFIDPYVQGGVFKPNEGKPNYGGTVGANLTIPFSEGGDVGLAQLARNIMSQRQMADRKTRGVFPQQQMNPAVGQLRKEIKPNFAGGGLVSFAGGSTEGPIQGDVIFDPLDEVDRAVGDTVGGYMRKPITAIGESVDYIRDAVGGIKKIIRPMRYGDSMPSAALGSSYPPSPQAPHSGDMLESQAATPAAAAAANNAKRVAQARATAAANAARLAATAITATNAPAFSSYEEDVGRLKLGERPKSENLDSAIAQDKKMRAAFGISDNPFADEKAAAEALYKQQGIDNLAARSEARNMGLIQSGLGIMGGTSQYFGTNFGEGAQKGIPAILEGNKEYQRNKQRSDEKYTEAKLAFKKGDVEDAHVRMKQAETFLDKNAALVAKYEDRATQARTAILSGHITRDSAERVAANSLRSAELIARERNQVLGRNPQLELLNAVAANPKLLAVYGTMHGVEAKDITAAAAILKAAAANPMEWDSPEQKLVLKQANSVMVRVLSGLAGSTAGSTTGGTGGGIKNVNGKMVYVPGG